MIPVYKAYKLRNGKEVAMSSSQSAIANKEWHVLAPENIAEIAASITMTIMVEKNDAPVTVAIISNWLRASAPSTAWITNAHSLQSKDRS